MTTATFARLATIACAALLAGAAQAQQSYDLRALNVAIGFPAGPPNNPTTSFQDFFNNGNPLAGGTYTGGVTGAGTYSTLANGLPPSAELSGPDSDYYGVNFGVGRMRFAFADATPNPTNLDPAGTTTFSSRLILNNPGATSLLNKGQSFEASTYWNFVTPDSMGFYGIRLNDNPGGGLAYNDLIDLRVIRGSDGQPVVSLRRLSSDGVVLTQSETFSQNVSAALFAGHTLSEVKLIELRLHYNVLGAGDPTVVRPAFSLVGATDDDIGLFEFTHLPTIFNGETFTRLQITSNWTVAVPEPGSALMLVGGLALLTAARRRRRA